MANTTEDVPKALVQKALERWIRDVGYAFDSQVKLEGDEMGRRFILRFAGVDETAASRSRQAFSGLRNEHGTWSFCVSLPLGKEVRLFASGDKNRET